MISIREWQDAIHRGPVTVGLVGNLKLLITAAQESKITVFYAPHHHTTKGD
jgi:hypothetical protein